MYNYKKHKASLNFCLHTYGFLIKSELLVKEKQNFDSGFEQIL